MHITNLTSCKKLENHTSFFPLHNYMWYCVGTSHQVPISTIRFVAVLCKFLSKTNASWDKVLVPIRGSRMFSIVLMRCLYIWMARSPKSWWYSDSSKLAKHCSFCLAVLCTVNTYGADDSHEQTGLLKERSSINLGVFGPSGAHLVSTVLLQTVHQPARVGQPEGDHFKIISFPLWEQFQNKFN